jgi:hypothetical protein
LAGRSPPLKVSPTPRRGEQSEEERRLRKEARRAAREQREREELAAAELLEERRKRHKRLRKQLWGKADVAAAWLKRLSEAASPAALPPGAPAPPLDIAAALAAARTSALLIGEQTDEE